MITTNIMVTSIITIIINDEDHLQHYCDIGTSNIVMKIVTSIMVMKIITNNMVMKIVTSIMVMKIVTNNMVMKIVTSIMVMKIVTTTKVMQHSMMIKFKWVNESSVDEDLGWLMVMQKQRFNDSVIMLKKAKI